MRAPADDARDHGQVVLVRVTHDYVPRLGSPPTRPRCRICGRVPDDARHSSQATVDAALGYLIAEPEPVIPA